MRVNLTVPYTATFENALTATANGSGAVMTSGNADFDDPQLTGVDRPSASPKVDERIAACETGGCGDLPSALGDDRLESGTYYHDGGVTIGGSDGTVYDTSAGGVDVVVDGDLTFAGSGGPGTLDHEVTGDGRVTFYVRGDVSIGGSTAVNTGGDSEDVVVLVHSNASSVSTASGSPQFTGLVYAPNSDLTINGGGKCGAGGENSDCDGNIVGAVVVGNATAVGGGKLNYHPPMGVGMEFDSAVQITYLHVTENRIEVTSD